jgi:hypothetical protein
MDPMVIIIVLALLATILALVLGLMTMSGGGAAHKEFSTRLMWSRVGLQALVIGLLFLALVLR